MPRPTLAVVLLAAGYWLLATFAGTADGQPSSSPLAPRPDATSGSRPDARLTKGVIGGPISPDGSEQVSIDILPALRRKNVGGSDGAGLCVFTSIMHSARDQNERRLWNIQEQMTREPGGGWPAKVDRMIAKHAAGAPYVQYEGTDLEVLRQALESGRSPGVTYDGTLDPHYQFKRIAHMVNLVHLSAKWACILDANFIGDDQLVWMPPESFARMWKGARVGWAVILLEPAAAPIPRN